MEVEGLCIPAPGFLPKQRPRVFREGLRYQRRVAAKLPALGAKVHLEVWLPGPCQPDILLEFSTSIIVMEVKLSAGDYLPQLQRYATALAPTGKRIWLVQVARNAAGWVPTCQGLEDIKNPYELIHWWI